ncbi:MAG TPA: DNA methyltransferase [Amycolatopsis sp.]|uniref:TRM11 family SAM-dependent methyltransferase n=1 Tax=Amycolatopsis sp. TaxID=37632 RepID=UPI002B4A27DC|nr:DNA methyltransferase [Amycolatopsis sp.]HKS46140.1 DNA methyltransferase [Amycolatopsis sp.]
MSVTSWRLLEGEDPEFVMRGSMAQTAWVSQLRPLIVELSEPGDLVFDPFAGWGTTMVACAVEGRRGIGVEIEKSRVEAARERLAGYEGQTMICGDARKPPLDDESVDMVLCDLPYFGTNYADDTESTFYALRDYDDYLGALDDVFASMARVMRPGAHAVVCVHNRRIAGRFVPLAWDTSRVLGRHLTLGDERIHLYPRQGEPEDPMVTNRAHEYVLVAKR